MKVTGHEYKELKNVHCFECDLEAKVLQRSYLFLHWCSYVECRVFLCPMCVTDHEGLHQLAGDEHESLKGIWPGKF